MQDSNDRQGRAFDPQTVFLEAIRKELPHAVVSMLAIPELACRQRPCVRHRDCALVTPAAQAACLEDLDPDLRALHDALHGEALRLLSDITRRTPPPVEPLSRDPDERELQEAAAAILHALLPPQGILRDRFRAWRRACEAVTRPPYAGQDLAEYRDFRRYIGAKRIAPELAGTSPACLPRPRNGAPLMS